MQTGQCTDGTVLCRGTYGNISVSSRWPVVPTSDTVISLSLIQHLSVTGYYPLLSVLYLGQHFPSPDVVSVSMMNLSLGFWQARIGAVQRISFSL
jgi:hypothetical protein